MLRTLYKHLALVEIGGLIYISLELAWRGRSHWTMFILGGICFVALGLINEVFPWDMPLWKQIVIGACLITALEFITGCVVNQWLGWGGMGLQQDAGQRPRADMPTIHPAVAASESGRDCLG